ELVAKALASGKTARKKDTALLQDSVRLAHVSTLACDLFHKDDGVEGREQFDELVKGAAQFEKRVAQIPDVDQPPPASNPADKGGSPNQPAAKGKAVPNKPTFLPGSLTARSKIDPSRPDFYSNEHLYNLKAGQPYTCTVESESFKAYLRVEDPSGT